MITKRLPQLSLSHFHTQHPKSGSILHTNFFQRKKNVFLEALCQTSPYISLARVSCYPKHKHWEENEVTMTGLKQASVNFWKGPADKYWVSQKSSFRFSKYLRKKETMASLKEPSVQAEEEKTIIIQGRCAAKGCEWCDISEKGMNKRWKRESQGRPLGDPPIGVCFERQSLLFKKMNKRLLM